MGMEFSTCSQEARHGMPYVEAYEYKWALAARLSNPTATFRSWVMYEAKDERSFTSLIAMQPLVTDHALMPHLKAMYVPFHMAYSGLICSKGLQSDRPKWRGMLAEVSQTSLCKAVGKTILIWCENRSCLSFHSVTWLFVGVGPVIIPHQKEDF